VLNDARFRARARDGASHPTGSARLTCPPWAERTPVRASSYPRLVHGSAADGVVWRAPDVQPRGVGDPAIWSRGEPYGADRSVSPRRQDRPGAVRADLRPRRPGGRRRFDLSCWCPGGRRYARHPFAATRLRRWSTASPPCKSASRPVRAAPAVPAALQWSPSVRDGRRAVQPLAGHGVGMARAVGARAARRPAVRTSTSPGGAPSRSEAAAAERPTGPGCERSSPPAGRRGSPSGSRSRRPAR
jgi:hypothetical protein